MEIPVDLDQGLCLERAERDLDDREGARVEAADLSDPSFTEDADCAAESEFETSGFREDVVIDVDVEDIESEPPAPAMTLPRINERFNTETRFHGLSLSQLAVHSLWIVDYLRQLGVTEMPDGDLESIGRCADDLESAIMLMFQLAGGTRQELRQRYQDIKLAMQARQRMTIDLGRAQ
jgi:hypothetical protein